MANNTKIKYTIFKHQGGLACQIEDEFKQVSYVSDPLDFRNIIATFFSKAPKEIRNLGDTLFIYNKDARLTIRDYHDLIGLPEMDVVVRNFEKYAEFDGDYVEILPKKHSRVNRTLSNNVAKVAVGVILVVVLGSAIVTSVVPDGTAVDVGQDIVAVATEQPNRETPNYITGGEVSEEDAVTFEADRSELDRPVSLYDETHEVKNLDIKTGYLAFDDLSDTEKAVRLRNKYYKYAEECAQEYGIDAELYMGMLTQEDGQKLTEIDEGGGIGPAQVQYAVWVDQDLTYYKLNKETQQFEKETMHITDSMLRDPVTNIHIGARIFQHYLKVKNYNIPQAVQSYNMGIGAMRDVVVAYAGVTGKNVEDIMNDPTDLGWTDYRYLKAGDPEYLEKVNMWLKQHTFTVINPTTNEPVSFAFYNDYVKKPGM